MILWKSMESLWFSMYCLQWFIEIMYLGACPKVIVNWNNQVEDTHAQQQCAAHVHAHANHESKKKPKCKRPYTCTHAWTNTCLTQVVLTYVLHIDSMCICICLWTSQKWKTNIAKKINENCDFLKNPDHSHCCNVENKGELFNFG